MLDLLQAEGNLVVRLAQILAISIAGISLFTFIHRLAFDALRDIPGPFLGRFTRLWELQQVISGDWHQKVIKLHKKYGSIVRIGPGRYDFSSPEAIKVIYSMSSGFPKSHFYDTFGTPGSKTILKEIQNSSHSLMRRKSAALYSMTTLLSYESAVDDQNTVLERKFREFARQGRTINLPSFMQFYAFDVVANITSAESLNMMVSEKDEYGLIMAIDYMHDYVNLVGVYYEWHLHIYKALMLFGRTPPTTGLYNYISGKIEARRQQPDPYVGQDFLSKLLKLEKEGKIEAEDVFGTFANNVIAGSDTTGISLGGLIYQIYEHPHVLAKLRDELKEHEIRGEISEPVKFSESQNLDYLQAVIKEGLRIHPAVGKQLARTVPPGGKVIEGRFFPEGTEVGSNAWAVHFDEDTYGPDVWKFRPERWLSENGQVPDRASSFAFGAGTRTCLGKNISLLEIMKVLPQIYRNFDIKILGGAEKAKYTSSWFVKQDYRARIFVRPS